jgi:hypothetical protein
MNKRADGPFTFLFTIGAFVLIWVAFLSGYINTMAGIAIERAGWTGLPAFVVGNLNLIIAACVIFVTLAWAYLVFK